jgi:hypothetical protein
VSDLRLNGDRRFGLTPDCRFTRPLAGSGADHRGVFVKLDRRICIAALY